MRDNLLIMLALTFIPYSLAALGGGHSVLAGIQHTAVDVNGWIASDTFAELFAAARIAPGPGSMLVTLIGWKMAGWSGAAIATLAFFLPSSILCLAAMHGITRYGETKWMLVLQDALQPIGAGLVLAGAVTILTVGEGNLLEWVLALAIAVIAYLRPSFHPLLLLSAGSCVLLAVN